MVGDEVTAGTVSRGSVISDGINARPTDGVGGTEGGR